jgi:3-oxoacyl-[acyl-carrier protein] reductase
MSDYLIRLGQQPALRNVIKSIGLPTPVELARGKGSYDARLLAGKTVLLGAGQSATAVQAVETALSDSGAKPARADKPEPAEGARYDALVFDATGMQSAGELKALYTFFHPVVRRMNRCGRVLVLADHPDKLDDPQRATAARAVEGFVRSVGKEIGKGGSTANLLYVEPGAQDRIEGPLRFFLSEHSAYVDGQPVRISAGGAMPEEVAFSGALKGKVALVTGGARGIGAATARRLAAEGAQVVCLDLPADQETLNATVSEIGGTALPLNITDDSAPRDIAKFLQDKFGGVDIVVHNAGVTRDKTLANMPEKHWDMVLSINLLAILAIDKVLLGDKVINEHGRIICLSSIGGIAGNMGQTNYGATKAGLIGYVKSQSQTLGERSITLNAVAPGFIETRMTAEMPFMIREAGRRMNSLSQGGQPEDVAELITFLSTPGAGGISGNVIRVCGQSLIGA